jgi:hypothetical protein
MHDQLQQSAAILARWQPLVAPLRDVHGYVPERRHGHRNGHLFRCIC